MTVYVGEAVTIVGAAFNPVASVVISDAVAQVEFYAPGKNPAKVPADRTADHGPVPMLFVSTVINKDGTVGAYVGYADTTGWLPGKWSYRVTLTGSFDSWEYSNFTLVA